MEDMIGERNAWTDNVDNRFDKFLIVYNMESDKF